MLLSSFISSLSSRRGRGRGRGIAPGQEECVVRGLEDRSFSSGYMLEHEVVLSATVRTLFTCETGEAQVKRRRR
jgi:hypothetical protein